MLGLTNDELEFLKKCNDEIRILINDKNLDELQTEIAWYLTSEDCMYYDEDGENWYTKKGKYVQNLYDKIIDWKYDIKN